MRLALALVLLATACRAPAESSRTVAEGSDPLRDVTTLAWISGSWIETAEGSRFEEHWTRPGGGTMVGMSRLVHAGATAFTEAIRIEEREDGIYYLVSPSGQLPAEFRLVEHLGWEAVFENTAGVSPYAVGYRLQADGTLLTWVELGGEQGRWKEFSRKRRGDL